MRSYYLDLNKDVRNGMYNSFDFDKDGIPRFPYPSGLFYNPTFICHFALYHYSLYLKYKRSNDLRLFIHISNWIFEHGEQTDSNFLLPYKFPFKGLSPPWISALGQGRLLSVLSRAYELSEDEKYLVAARKAMKPFETPVKDGGVQTHFPDGGVAFEEYPLQKPNIVLNGFITSLVGLYDLGSIGKENRATELFMQGIRSLENNLHRYDLGYWSAYDLRGYMASKNYHQYHIIQLWALYEMTSLENFKLYSSMWSGCRGGLQYYILRNFSRGKKLICHPKYCLGLIKFRNL